MRNKQLLAAIAEARRFLEKAERLRAVERADPVLALAGSDRVIYHGARAAAVRRASLDLTRALADLRRRES